MKIVLYNKETKKVIEVIEGIVDPVVDGIRITWNGGMLDGLRCGFLIVEDDAVIGEMIEDEELRKVIDLKVAEVNEKVGEVVKTQFTSKVTGHSYHTEIHDQLYFQRNLITLISDPDIESIEHKNSEGDIILHSREEYIAMTEELNRYINKNVQRGWELKEAARSAQSIEELEEINIDFS